MSCEENVQNLSTGAYKQTPLPSRSFITFAMTLSLLLPLDTLIFFDYTFLAPAVRSFYYVILSDFHNKECFKISDFAACNWEQFDM